MDMASIMDMDIQHEHVHAAWTWTCSMDMDTLHGPGQWTCMDAWLLECR
jgi:hypothetical protein